MFNLQICLNQYELPILHSSGHARHHFFSSTIRMLDKEIKQMKMLEDVPFCNHYKSKAERQLKQIIPCIHQWRLEQMRYLHPSP